ncbi:hypothetical protein GGR52DRAFT_592840 [Hypoxylon sp. FL1284]|nr:hypothetical protein GGR52DRAFT_592840 [Hypoxylon sp. FL1284]
MPQAKKTIVPEGILSDRWAQAQANFLKSSGLSQSELEEQADLVLNPEEWLNTFQGRRHDDSNRFYTICSKIGVHLGTIRTCVQVVEVPVKAVSSAVPTASPASLIVGAFAWLFNSFAKIAKSFDDIEGFFAKIASRLESLQKLEDYLAREDKSDNLSECIIRVFECCLSICIIANEQVQNRFETFFKSINVKDKLGVAFNEFATADDNLRVCLGMETLASVTETQQDLVAFMDKISGPIARDERDEVLEWLSSLNSPQMHAMVKQDTQGGNWLLESDPFRKWRDKSQNWIWYTGNPGAGKSVLAATIIDHLMSRAQDRSSKGNETMVAYLYLSYRLQPDMAALLGSILRQFQTGCDLHQRVKDKFRESHRGGRYDGQVPRPSLEDIKSLLSLVSESKTVFVVVDALDEFDLQSRGPLLEHIKDIKSDVKILVTSRYLEYLDKLRKDFLTGTIEAHDDDMDEYIERQIRGSPNLSYFPPRLHEEIKTQVKRRSGRMFIIVKLHMGALTEVEVEAELKNALEKLPDKVDTAYVNTVDRIRRRPEKHRRVAFSTLG